MIFRKKTKNFHLGHSWRHFNVQRKAGISASCSARSLNHYDNFFASAGISSLHYAAHFASVEIVELIYHGVGRPDPLTNAEVTPIGFACEFNSRDVGEPKLLKDFLSQRARREKRSSSSSILAVCAKQREGTKKAP